MPCAALDVIKLKGPHIRCVYLGDCITALAEKKNTAPGQQNKDFISLGVFLHTVDLFRQKLGRVIHQSHTPRLVINQRFVIGSIMLANFEKRFWNITHNSFLIR